MQLKSTPNGLIELRLSKDGDRFYYFAELVRAELNGVWKEQLDGLDQSYWDLDVDGVVLTVHREHYLGVSVYCSADDSKVALLERLKRAFDNDASSCE